MFEVGESLCHIFLTSLHMYYIFAIRSIYIYIFFTDMNTSCALSTWKTGLYIIKVIYLNQLYDLYLLVHMLAVNLLIALCIMHYNVLIIYNMRSRAY